MNTCIICETEQRRLVDVYIQGRGLVGVCTGCIRELVHTRLLDLEQQRIEFCRGCAQSTDGGGCLQNVTWRTCA